MSRTIHGTCLAIGDEGILLRGPSGSGKSDLAFRILKSEPNDGAHLVADDQVTIEGREGQAIASAPPVLAGSLELRGLGIVLVPTRAEVALALIVDLVPRNEVDRMPEPRWETLEGALLPLVRLHAFDVTTPDKIRLALDVIPRSGFPDEDGRLG